MHDKIIIEFNMHYDYSNMIQLIAALSSHGTENTVISDFFKNLHHAIEVFD